MENSNEQRAALIRSAAELTDLGLDGPVFTALSELLLREHQMPVAGTAATAAQIRNSAALCAEVLTRVCTDSGVLVEIVEKDKRKGVRLAAFSNEHFPAPEACKRLDAGDWEDFTVWQFLLISSGRYDQAVEAFAAEPSSPLPAEVTVVGVRTSAEFRRQYSRRLTAGDSDLLLGICDLIAMQLAGTPAQRKRELAADWTPLGVLLCSLIGQSTAPFDIRVAQRLISTNLAGLAVATNLGLGPNRHKLSGELHFDKDALRYLHSLGSTSTASASSSRERAAIEKYQKHCITFSNTAHSYCRDAELGRHHDLQQRGNSWDGPVCERLMFSSDATVRATALADWVRSGNRQLRRYTLQALDAGYVTGWEGLTLASTLLDNANPGRGPQALADSMINAAAPSRADLDDIVAGLVRNATDQQPFVAHQAAAVLSCLADRFTDHEINELVITYTDEHRHDVELRALLRAVRPKNKEMRCHALLRYPLILTGWLDGEIWGEPTAEDASAVMEAACGRLLQGPQLDMTISRTLLAGGLPQALKVTLCVIDNPLVAREMIRRYEDAFGLTACVEELKPLGVSALTDWLEARPRSSADIAVVIRTWFAGPRSWMPTTLALEFIEASGDSPEVLAAFTQCTDPELLEVMLGFASFPEPLALETLCRMPPHKANLWLAGELPGGPAVTEENLLSYLSDRSASNTDRGGWVMSPAQRLIICSEEVAAAGLASVLRTYPRVPQMLGVYLTDPHECRLSTTWFALAGIVSNTLNTAGPELAGYALELMRTWEGSFEELDLVLRTVRAE